jgi:3-ketoacyl-CoA synthase
MTLASSRDRFLSSDSDSGVETTGPQHRVYKVQRSKLISLINWYHVSSVFFPYILVGLISLFVFQFSYSMYENRGQVEELIVYTVTGKPAVWLLGWQGTFLTLTLVYLFARVEPPCYLVEFVTWEPPPEWKVNHAQLLKIMRAQQCFSDDSMTFLAKILAQSGTGQTTAWPPSIVQCLLDGKPQDTSVESARAESKRVICDVIRDLLQRTGTQPQEVDILIVNCSLFSPTPSLCALAAHEFGMRTDLASYNLSGMGCSASVIAVDLAKQLLRARPNALALVVSTENLTQNLYLGNDRSMLLQNTLFRCGGAAMLLSNRRSDSLRAKFKLLHTLRKQGIDDESYECVFECQDSMGHRGVRLSKQIVKVAGRAMERNFTSLGPHVLPVSEMYKVARAMVLRDVFKRARVGLEALKLTSLARKVPVVRPYVPDFKRGIDHWCIHAGGRAVVDGVGENLKLGERQIEPSKATLYKYTIDHPTFPPRSKYCCFYRPHPPESTTPNIFRARLIISCVCACL